MMAMSSIKELLNVDLGDLIPEQEEEKSHDIINISKMLEISLDDGKHYIIYNHFEYCKKYISAWKNLTEEEFVFRFNLYEIINVNIILDMYLERYNEFSIMGGLLSKQEAENMVDMLNKFKKFMDE